jgi:succinate dehydrogenase/fumarate reductase flavoprotein subunit
MAGTEKHDKKGRGKMSTVTYEKTDVLVIGGGLAGAMAAIRAADEGADVIVLEQANTYRSGNAGSGVDHLHGYIPQLLEPKGYRPEDLKYDKAIQAFGNIGFARTELIDYFVDASYDVIVGLEKFGIKVRGFEFSDFPDGFWPVSQFHSIPTSIVFNGRDIKVALTEGMKQAGVRIFNRFQAVEVLKNDEVATGAIAVSTKDDEVVVVSAKATILATSAGISRIAQTTNTTQSKNEQPSAANYGSGVILAINAGADAVNLEFSLSNGGSYFANHAFMAGAPGGSWYPAGRVVDDEGKVVVDRIHIPDFDDPEYWEKNASQLSEFYKGRQRINQLLSENKPLYLDLSAATDEEIEHILWALSNEGEMWLFTEYLKEKGIDPRKYRVPLAYRNKVSVAWVGLPGVLVDTDFKTTVDGLYAAGAIQGASGATDAAGSMIFGDGAGKSAAVHAREISEVAAPGKVQVDVLLEKVRVRREAEVGDYWKDIEHEVQAIVSVAGVSPFSETRVRTGIRLLEQLKDGLIYTAKDPFELAKSFEAEFLIETALALFHTILERKDSVEPIFQRVDERGEVKPAPSNGGGTPIDQEIIGIRKENGRYAFRRFKGNVKKKPVGYRAAEF